MTTEQLIATGYTIYRPDGSEEQGSVDWPDSPTTGQIRQLVEPIVEGPMEHVRVLDPAKVELVDHSVYRGVQVVEIWDGGVFLACLYPGAGPEARHVRALRLESRNFADCSDVVATRIVRFRDA